jgi:hypothetical protein
MFSDQSFYESKVFLRSYKDAIDCLKLILINLFLEKQLKENLH